MNNEPAFPTDITPGNIEGMSLLDYFAGQALAGLINDSSCSRDCVQLADVCYRQAEAMMDERKHRSEVNK